MKKIQTSLRRLCRLKTFPILIFITLTGVSNINAQTVYGEANLFEYDDAGNRVVRRYEVLTIISSKPGRDGEEEKVDTLTQEFDKGLAEKDMLIIKAYPNPVSDILIIENLSWKSHNSIVIKLFDITGKLILTKSTSAAKEQISFSNVVPGTYHVHYYLNNNLLSNWKIIKN